MMAANCRPRDASSPNSLATTAAIMGVVKPSEVPAPPSSATMKTKSMARATAPFSPFGPSSAWHEVLALRKGTFFT